MPEKSEYILIRTTELSSIFPGGEGFSEDLNSSSRLAFCSGLRGFPWVCFTLPKLCAGCGARLCLQLLHSLDGPLEAWLGMPNRAMSSTPTLGTFAELRQLVECLGMVEALPELRSLNISTARRLLGFLRR